MAAEDKPRKFPCLRKLLPPHLGWAACFLGLSLYLHVRRPFWISLRCRACEPTPRIVKFAETESRTEITRARGRGWGVIWDGVAVWDDEKVLEVNGGDVYMISQTRNAVELHT